MATQRYISTSFWDDEWVQGLDPSEKFVYLYLLTNPLTNIAGIYKITIRRITFDTGYNAETVGRILERFKKDGKAILVGEYMILPAWPKHQKWEKKDTIREGIDAIIRQLPDEIRAELPKLGYQYSVGVSYPYGPNSVGVSYPYGPSYLDSDIDSDSNLDSDRDKDIDSNPVFSPSVGNDGLSRIEKARKVWNDKADTLPPYRFIATKLREHERGPILRTISAYSDDEIFQAITNYAKIKSDIDMEPFPVYATFAGFMAGGVEKYADDAKPFDRCRKRGAQESGLDALARIRRGESQG